MSTATRWSTSRPSRQPIRTCDLALRVRALADAPPVDAALQLHPCATGQAEELVVFAADRRAAAVQVGLGGGVEQRGERVDAAAIVGSTNAADSASISAMRGRLRGRRGRRRPARPRSCRCAAVRRHARRSAPRRSARSPARIPPAPVPRLRGARSRRRCGRRCARRLRPRRSPPRGRLGVSGRGAARPRAVRRLRTGAPGRRTCATAGHALPATGRSHGAAVAASGLERRRRRGSGRDRAPAALPAATRRARRSRVSDPGPPSQAVEPITSAAPPSSTDECHQRRMRAHETADARGQPLGQHRPAAAAAAQRTRPATATVRLGAAVSAFALRARPCARDALRFLAIELRARLRRSSVSRTRDWRAPRTIPASAPARPGGRGAPAASAAGSCP